MTQKVLLTIFCCFATFHISKAQYKVEPVEGYSPQIGLMVDMLEELKDRITQDVKDLSIEETDYLFDEQANSIGSIIMHLAAIEVYYQTETLEERNLTVEESEYWGLASDLGDRSRAELKGKPIIHYLQVWDEVRAKSLAGLKERDDEWFKSDIDEEFNNHWVWFHVLEHQANHMGQIALILNRLNK